MTLPYDPSIKDSILAYAKKLEGHSLKTICNQEILAHEYSGKGSFGQLLEKFYFLYEPNSDAEPDFPIAQLELKSSPLKTLKSKEYRSKERLVLNIINYEKIIDQTFYESSFWKKNSSLLLIFYLHKLNTDVLDYEIKIVNEWSFSDIDLEIIKNDWEIIKNKVLAGKAHELSEGDTFYLGACTKGGQGGNPRVQPNNKSHLAKQRAFSLKQGYVNHIVALSAKNKNEVFGKLITNQESVKNKTIEDIVYDKFQPLIGKSDKELVSLLKIRLNEKAKNYYSNISKEIIKTVFNVPSGFNVESYIEEFKKADITVRTVRIKENGKPAEDISFPTFDYIELVNQSWDESDFKAALEGKFLFVFFQLEKDKLVLKKVKFWNMPHDDLLKAEAVWEKTKSIVENGKIVARTYQNKSGKLMRKTNFPNKDFSDVAHVRPHAQNAKDTYKLPVPDKLTLETNYTKHCFWLNGSYIRNKIYF